MAADVAQQGRVLTADTARGRADGVGQGRGRRPGQLGHVEERHHHRTVDPDRAPVDVGEDGRGDPGPGDGEAHPLAARLHQGQATAVGIGRRDLVGAAQAGAELLGEVEVEVAGAVQLAADGPGREVGRVDVDVPAGRPGGDPGRQGGAGVAGPVVVPFFQPGTNAASLPDTLSAVAGCVDVDRDLAGRIAASPRDFYVNIHTAEFPNGAVRGQLHRAGRLHLDLPSQLAAKLRGANEVPPADQDGRGLALVRTGRQRVCFAVGWARITPPLFAHIHRGPAGVNGPVVVLFFDVPELNPDLPMPPAQLPATVSAAAGCVHDQDPALLQDIRRQPNAYYVNVHTPEFPGGAIRGQLRRVA